MVLADAGHRCAATVSSMGVHTHIPVGFQPVHLRKHGLCCWVDACRLGRRPRLYELIVDVGKKRHRWRSFLLDGGWTWSTRNLVCSWPALLEDSKRAPAPGPPCSWPLCAPLGGLRVLRYRSDPDPELSSPPSSATSGTLAAVGLTPKRPRATFRRVLSTRNNRLCAVRLLQSRLRVGQAQAGNAVVVAIRQVFDRSHADKAVGRHLTRIGRAGKDSDLIVACSAFILPLELIIFACFATIGHSIGLAWANRTSGNVGGKEFP